MQFNTRSALTTVKLLFKKNYQIEIKLIFLISILLFSFQNCSQPGGISVAGQNLNSTADTNAATDSPALTPLTKQAAVTTILLALGDEANNQLVINGNSSQLIAETIIRYSSPVSNPKILVVQDQNIHGEDPEDTVYIVKNLLARYNPQFLVEPVDGLKPEDLMDYDLVWFNNPGHPMSNVRSYQTLLRFKGAVVLQGDDLSQGIDFSIEELTHLKYIDNGTNVICNGTDYPHDNNSGNQYRVSLNANKFLSADQSEIQFRYGNDIDNTSLSISYNDVEILAKAYGGPEVCTESRPAIVRYLKK